MLFQTRHSSVLVSNPGSVVLSNCRWVDMVAPGGVMYAGYNAFQNLTGTEELKRQDVSLTVLNSTFEKVQYGHAFVETFQQSLSIRGCQFRDIRLWSLSTQCDDLGEVWCQSLWYCQHYSICRLEDICMDDFEYASTGYLLAFDNTSQATVSGTHFLADIKQYGPAVGSAQVCPFGLFETDLHNFYPQSVECIDGNDFDANWTAAATCSFL